MASHPQSTKTTTAMTTNHHILEIAIESIQTSMKEQKKQRRQK